jgi:aminotransferase
LILLRREGCDFAGHRRTGFHHAKPILDAGIRSLQNGETHYTSNHGKIELRQGIADNLQKLYNVKYDSANEVIATVGVSEALYLTFTPSLNQAMKSLSRLRVL